jgi:tetratricopeptide (TPR) repeat protein
MPPNSDRLEKLQQMLARDPNDTFLLYGIAMEHKKRDDHVAALEFFDRVTSLDPGYCYAYHQKGLVHESQGNADAAKQAYRDGIRAAIRKGDDHARGEIEAALSMIEQG